MISMANNINSLNAATSILGTRPLFLDHSVGDWRSCLDQSLRFLRNSWQMNWVGLPFVVDACADFLQLNETAHGSTAAKLLSCARQVAFAIEAESVVHASKGEPIYHNRLHFADVLTTITLQATIESAHWKLTNTTWHAAMILIALAHDLNHPGRINKTTAEIESLSFAALKPSLQKNKIPSSWVKRIEKIIIRSDFSFVSQNHQRIKNKTFSWCTDWAIVLLNEADIMTSVNKEFGPNLGQALAKEWELISFPAYRTVATWQGRLDFLSDIEFSSYSASLLGMTDDLREQLNQHD